jgi:hypothetical protein
MEMKKGVNKFFGDGITKYLEIREQIVVQVMCSNI